MSKWRDMKTAPRDGTHILGWVDQHWIEGFYWVETQGMGGAWHFASDGDYADDRQPKCWQPWPEPPKE